MKRLNVLVICSARWLKIDTVRDFSRSFGAFSAHRIQYVDHLDFSEHPQLVHSFDAVVILFPVRIPFSSLSTHSLFDLRSYTGTKAVFLQDEYERTKETWEILRWAKFNIIFSSIGGDPVTDLIYPANKDPEITIEHVLTGYLWTESEKSRIYQPSDTVPSGKPLHLVYRGRTLPARYGVFGEWKRTVPVALREEAARANLKVDVEIDDRKRLDGKRWTEFLASGRATLILPSGSAVFDLDAELEERIRLATQQQRNPASVIADYELDSFGGVIPPRVFEALLAGTCLVGLKSWYSELLSPDKHYIAIDQDLSNLSEVVDQIKDNQRVDEVWQRAHADLVENPEFTYQALVRKFDEALEMAELKKQHGPLPLHLPLTVSPSTTKGIALPSLDRESPSFITALYGSLIEVLLRMAKFLVPRRVRRQFKRLLLE